MGGGGGEGTHLFAQLLQSYEEARRGVSVPSLSLDGLHYHCSDLAPLLVPLLNEVGRLLQTSLLLRFILSFELVQRVLEHREWSNGPIKCRNIELVYGLGVGGGKTPCNGGAHGCNMEPTVQGLPTKRSPMEGTHE